MNKKYLIMTVLAGFGTVQTHAVSQKPVNPRKEMYENIKKIAITNDLSHDVDAMRTLRLMAERLTEALDLHRYQLQHRQNKQQQVIDSYREILIEIEQMQTEAKLQHQQWVQMNELSDMNSHNLHILAKALNEHLNENSNKLNENNSSELYEMIKEQLDLNNELNNELHENDNSNLEKAQYDVKLKIQEQEQDQKEDQEREQKVAGARNHFLQMLEASVKQQKEAIEKLGQHRNSFIFLDRKQLDGILAQVHQVHQVHELLQQEAKAELSQHRKSRFVLIHCKKLDCVFAQVHQVQKLLQEAKAEMNENGTDQEYEQTAFAKFHGSKKDSE